MTLENEIFLVMALSFVATVGVFALLVRAAPRRLRVLVFFIGAVGAVAWLGIIKGLIATVVVLALSSGYVSTRLDARRIGKRVASNLNIRPSVFFSAIEQTLPLYLTLLAALEREGLGVPHATRTLLPYLETGLDALEARFGQQAMIDEARIEVERYRMASSSQ
jgi:hypothetical protein